jgi:hypothetical protein
MTGLSRAGFYRWRVPRQTTPVEMELRDQMQKVALESPATEESLMNCSSEASRSTINAFCG